MTTDYVSLETAKLLKEVGYSQADSKVLAKPVWVKEDSDEYINHIYSPHLYDAQIWLRDAKGIYIYILPINQFRDADTCNKILYYSYNFEFVDRTIYPIKEITYKVRNFSTYELALDKAIAEACGMIINLKK